jgi:hypothetical protein
MYSEMGPAAEIMRCAHTTKVLPAQKAEADNVINCSSSALAHTQNFAFFARAGRHLGSISKFYQVVKWN